MSSSIEDAAVAAVTRLAESCADILQSSLVAAILHGSLTMDDFRREAVTWTCSSLWTPA